MKATFSSHLASLVTLAVTSTSWAESIRVPDDHKSIQAAIAEAEEGDRVVVAAGT